MKRAKKPKQQAYTLTRKQVKEMCHEQVEKAFLLMATAAADEMDLDDNELVAIAQRAARYAGYVDNHLTRMDQVSKTLEEKTGIKWWW